LILPGVINLRVRRGDKVLCFSLEMECCRLLLFCLVYVVLLKWSGFLWLA
jgi:hypothetical protein